MPVTLAFTAGFVDTFGFVALFSFFTAHVTGNFVILGASLVQPIHGLIAKVLALPMFIVAVRGVRMYGLFLEKRERAVAPRLLALEATFLLVFLALGLLATPIRDADSPLAILTALGGVIAMGVQSAASRTVFASLSPTTVMTGNVTELVLDCVDLLTGVPPGDRKSLVSRVRKFWPPIVAFAAGATAGAIGYAAAGFLCLTIPTALVLGLTVLQSAGSQISRTIKYFCSHGSQTLYLAESRRPTVDSAFDRSLIVFCPTGGSARRGAWRDAHLIRASRYRTSSANEHGHACCRTGYDQHSFIGRLDDCIGTCAAQTGILQYALRDSLQGLSFGKSIGERS